MRFLSRQLAARVGALMAATLFIGCFTASADTKRAALSVSPGSLSFTAVQGSASPGAKSISVTNAGVGSLRWTVSNATGASWMAISPTQGSGSGTVTVSVSTAGLSASTYYATVRFTQSTGAVTNVAVTLTVTSAPAPAPTNNPPTVLLTSPTNGASFTAPATINLAASASDSDGVARVDFYNGSALIGTGTSSPYSASWTNVAAGTYSIKAIATDTLGAAATSSIVTVTVAAAATNAPPTVSITSPNSGATYTAPATVTIAANAADSNGTVSRVDFYAGTNLIGSSTASPYAVSWANVAAGTYTLSAKATDNAGATTSSSPVSITVNASSTPAYDRAIYPGENIQSVVDSYPTGTRFLLKTGTFHQQQVRPKSGNAFYGEAGTVLDGDNVTQYAFETLATAPTGVIIQYLTIQNYAPPKQNGAIQGDNGVNWTVADNEVRNIANEGVRPGQGAQILRNYIHHCGTVGISGWRAHGVVVQDNQVAYNNPSNVSQDPVYADASGIKFFETSNGTVRHNNVHDNNGAGIWFDHGWPTALIEDNTVTANRDAGIWHEVSYDAVIRNNTVTGNGGTGGTGWLERAGINVTNSPNVQVYGNVVKNNANGIGVMQASGYTDGPYGANVVQNLSVHDNTVTMTTGRTGLAQNTGDTSVYTSRNNQFTHNTYYLGANSIYFLWNEQNLAQQGWQGYGNDTTGTFIRF